MRILLIALILFIGVSESRAQQQFTYCVDSTRIEDKFWPCGTSYEPVCGCDNVTYKNECAAYYWGGLLDGSWTTSTVCGNFDINFYPTAVSNFPGTFSIFLKTISPVTLYIYDAFGKLKFSEYYSTISCSNSFNPNILCREIPVQNLDMGVYILIAVVNGEHQSVKFAKISKFE